MREDGALLTEGRGAGKPKGEETTGLCKGAGERQRGEMKYGRKGEEMEQRCNRMVRLGCKERMVDNRRDVYLSVETER